mmetsp:Transcript_18691/g.56507  ORF Transcript_18691/g.56507 Transcript_18691/m.56507 type:complete len:291 (+) Transcript_18691:2639-3511(+)
MRARQRHQLRQGAGQELWHHPRQIPHQRKSALSDVRAGVLTALKEDVLQGKLQRRLRGGEHALEAEAQRLRHSRKRVQAAHNVVQVGLRVSSGCFLEGAGCCGGGSSIGGGGGCRHRAGGQTGRQYTHAPRVHRLPVLLERWPNCGGDCHEALQQGQQFRIRVRQRGPLGIQGGHNGGQVLGIPQRPPHRLRQRGQCVIQHAHIAPPVQQRRRRQSLQHCLKAGQKVGAGLLLQGGQGAAGRLLHVLVAVQHPPQQPLYHEVELQLPGAVRLLPVLDDPVGVATEGPASD